MVVSSVVVTVGTNVELIIVGGVVGYAGVGGVNCFAVVATNDIGVLDCIVEGGNVGVLGGIVGCVIGRGMRGGIVG